MSDESRTADESASNTLIPRRAFRFQYETIVDQDLAAPHPVDVWIPLPSTDAHQRVGALEISASVEVTERVAGANRMLFARVPRGHGTEIITVSYDVVRSIHRVEPPAEDADFAADFDWTPYRDALAANAKVPLDGAIGEDARAIVGAHDKPVIKARKLFDHLLETFEYDWGGCTLERIDELGDLARACDLQTGTCTEFHGLYAGYARALGIPAEFVFGFNIPMNHQSGAISGYHCWAEILLPEVGWLPIDITEAVKGYARGEDITEFCFGGLHAHRVASSRGRDLWLEPRQPGAPIDKFIFSHAVAGHEPVQPLVSFSFSEPRGPLP